jgi:hypothetical protein
MTGQRTSFRTKARTTQTRCFSCITSDSIFNTTLQSESPFRICLTLQTAAVSFTRLPDTMENSNSAGDGYRYLRNGKKRQLPTEELSLPAHQKRGRVHGPGRRPGRGHGQGRGHRAARGGRIINPAPESASFPLISSPMASQMPLQAPSPGVAGDGESVSSSELSVPNEVDTNGMI